MAKQVTDDEADLKRQARRRLIGAVALTTAVVVILPMVLDKEPKPTTPDIDLRIPDKDKAGEFLPQAGQSAVPVAATSAPVAASSVVTPVLPVSAVSVAAPAISADEVVAEKPVAAAQPVAKPAEKIVEKAAESAPSKPSSNERHPEKTKAEDKPATGGFVLQIGAYSNPEIAADWQKKLSKQGLHAYTEKGDGKTRLRVGPFSSREAADKARAKLELMALHPDLVELEKN
ncbi:MAG: SPOR domain-containing protein [Nitrosomonadales bacterium]|nr:SPOR domain-containing protein [Nitrosomonadales bacterium]